MSFENADSNIIDGKVQNLSQSRVQYALSAFKPTECLNWVNHRIFTPKLVSQKCQIFFSWNFSDIFGQKHFCMFGDPNNFLQHF